MKSILTNLAALILIFVSAAALIVSCGGESSDDDSPSPSDDDSGPADGGDDSGDNEDDSEDDTGDDSAGDDSEAFDEDPIVFVHGYFVNFHEWDTMIERFREIGYPEDMLWAVDFTSTIQSSRINARDELAPFVDEVLAATGAEKVDIISHSMGGLSTRLWIKSYGGAEKVRDYVSLSGTHHGTAMSCLIPWLGQGSAETCPIYAQEDESVNLVQWELNGDPDSADVDETPFGVEDGGGIYWNALRTDADVIDVPSHTCCLNQSFRGDCSDPVNVQVHGVGHIEMAYDPDVFVLASGLVRAHNLSKP